MLRIWKTKTQSIGLRSKIVFPLIRGGPQTSALPFYTQIKTSETPSNTCDTSKYGSYLKSDDNLTATKLKCICKN